MRFFVKNLNPAYRGTAYILAQSHKGKEHYDWQGV